MEKSLNEKEKEKHNMHQLSPQDKRLFNILEIKVYDISQNVQLLGRQMSSNQIKDIVAHSYNIYCQLGRVFQKIGAEYLFNLIKKIQINGVLLSQIATQKLEILSASQQNKKKGKNTQRNNTQRLTNKSQNQANKQQSESKTKITKIHKLGGISLYNQSYQRGLECYELPQGITLQMLQGKCKIKQSKNNRQAFLSEVAHQLQAKTDVQMKNLNDQIENHISSYKQRTSNFNSSIDYEKQFGDIIDFFKISQKEAMNFLNKAASSNQYTQDYINKIQDIQRDIKQKQKDDKTSLQEKLQIFIIKMKNNMLSLETLYAQKEAKLIQYQKSLKKQTQSISVQTHDGYDKKIRDLNQTIKEHQQKYKILAQIKKRQYDFQDKFYQASYMLQLKEKQITKIKTQLTQQGEQLDQFKKGIRDNKMKNKGFNSDNATPQNISPQKDSIEPQIVIQDVKEKKSSARNSRFQKNTRRFEKNKSSIFSPDNQNKIKQQEKPSQQQKIVQEKLQIQNKVSQQYQQQTKKSQRRQSPILIKKPENIQPKHISLSSKSASRDISICQSWQKQSIFKDQIKKLSKHSNCDQEKQVTFDQQARMKTSLSHIDYQDVIQQRNISTSGRERSDFSYSKQSIDNCKNNATSDDFVRRGLPKKTFLRQKIQVSQSSFKTLDENDDKFGVERKSSKFNQSKKCIILKETKKQKNIIAKQIKRSNLEISQTYNFTWQIKGPQIPKERLPRTSYPLIKQAKAQYKSDSNNKRGSRKKIRSGKKIFNVDKSSIKSSQKDLDKSRNHSQKHINSKKITDKSRDQDKGPTLLKNISNNLSKMPKNKKQVTYKQSKQSSSKNIKDLNKLANYITKIQQVKNIRNSGNIQQWKIPVQQENDQLMNYMIQISKEQINLNELEQIIKIIQEQSSNQVSKADLIQRISKSINTKQFSTQIRQEIESMISKQKQKQNQFDQSKRNSYKDLNQTQKLKKQGTQKNIVANIARQSRNSIKDTSFQFHINVFQRITQLHSINSKCHSKTGQCCHHLEQYFQILRRLQGLTQSGRDALKLPVQKIGEPYEQQQQLAKITRNTVMASGNYSGIKANMDQYLKQRDRILPIINNTTSNYYKGKAKHTK